MSALRARHREIKRIAGLLDGGGGLLLIYGPDAEEAIDVTAAALRTTAALTVGIVDLDACVNNDEVAERTATAIAGALLGDPRLLHVSADRRSSQQQSAWIDMQRLMGPAFEKITSGWRRVLPGEPAAIISAAVDVFGHSAGIARPTLTLYGADALIDIPRSRFNAPDDLLWAIRSAAQGAPELRLVLVGGPATIELVSESEYAFYGWGRPLELTRLNMFALAEEVALEFRVSQSYGRRIAELSDGLPRVAWALATRLLERLRSAESSPEGLPEDPVQSAWAGLLDERSSLLRSTARLLADLHRAALPVCQTLANGGAPYTAAHSGEVTRALKLLHARGICESPAPRTWRLTDPVLAGWLRGEHGAGSSDPSRPSN